MPSLKNSKTPAGARTSAPLLLGYGAACLVAWLLFVLAGTEFQRGLWQLWEAVYQATLTLWAPMLLGLAVLPLAHWFARHEPALPVLLFVHLLAALLFSITWLGLDYGAALLLFGAEHADATLEQSFLWRAIWGLLVYAVLATGFVAALNARRAKLLAVTAAQAESALARAELAVISGKLNPHFLFNTLNSIIALTRKDARAAEAALLRFSGMLRYVLATKREATDRVTLQEELDFLRDYLALEALRLGQRLKIEWELDERTLEDEIPPLTLQPLVENSIVHGIAPRMDGGCITISAQRDALTDGLNLCVRDDGEGCDPAQLDAASARPGIGLGALRRRFALDYEGRARLRVHTAPGAGFRVDLWIPQS
ncbi:sensor histidine kinase [Roseateles microcysteis]|uniref:sensor histidine kinase n=1 Tax=Roseateles microcysteis TaxID=3119057 RepID=UPI002FE67562